LPDPPFFSHQQRFSIIIFTARRYASVEGLNAMVRCPSVCPSLNHTSVLYRNFRTYRHDYQPASRYRPTSETVPIQRQNYWPVY